MSFDRKIQAVGQKKDVMEGAGVLVGRALPQSRLGLEPLDPFLMLDHFKMPAGGPGFPEHPHRGFEILTYIRTGFGSHKDNFGNEGTVKAGGLMRLTAGKGMWHGEGGGVEKPGEMIEGLQFWVNLPRSLKKVDPEFQLAQDQELPRQSQDGGKTSVKVLVGPGSPVKIRTPMVYLEVTVQPGGHFEWELPKEHQGFAYVLDGSGWFGAGAGESAAAEGQVAVFGEGGGLKARNEGKQPLVFVMAAGQPHREPVVWNGPFVD
jgi:redox-sensitive bicupin YhaK (pirin superfamily)